MFGFWMNSMDFVHSKTIEFIRHFADDVVYNRFIQIKSEIHSI